METVPTNASPDEPRIEIKIGARSAVPQVGQPELKRKKLAIIPVFWRFSERFCLRKCKIKKSRPMSTDCTRLINDIKKKSGKVRPIPKTVAKVWAIRISFPRKLESWKSCQLADPAAKKLRRKPKTRKQIKKGQRKWRFLKRRGRFLTASWRREKNRRKRRLIGCFLIITS